MPGIGCSGESCLPRPLSPQAPPTTLGVRPGTGRGTRLEKEGGGEERLGSCTRLIRCRCASSAFPPPASPSFPPPSVCLPWALSDCSAAPRLIAIGWARSLTSSAGAQSRRAPAWPAQAAARGPLSRGQSVRRRGPETRSAAERGGAG